MMHRWPPTSRNTRRSVPPAAPRPDVNPLVTTLEPTLSQETSPLKDTATESWKGHPRTPTQQPIHPIGHVGLIIPPESELKHLSLPLTGVAYIGKLYVSYALQSYGYGGVTMRAVEAISRDQLGADMCILDTILHEYQMRPDVMERFYVQHGNPLPKVSKCAEGRGGGNEEVLTIRLPDIE